MRRLERLNGIFREVFADPSIEVSRATDASQIPAWDSFNHISLITSIEDAFSVQFTTREIGSFTCVGDVLDLLAEKGISDET
jgi:acyl carrier protein